MITKLRKFLEFDEPGFLNYLITYAREHSGERPTLYDPARWENARTREVIEAMVELIEPSERLLERIDHNGGIGEYDGGPAFVIEPLRKALANLRAKLDEAEGKNE